MNSFLTNKGYVKILTSCFKSQWMQEQRSYQPHMSSQKARSERQLSPMHPSPTEKPARNDVPLHFEVPLSVPKRLHADSAHYPRTPCLIFVYILQNSIYIDMNFYT